jgi:hypothetical protein
MLASIIELFQHIKKRTSMYVLPVDYHTVASFISGYDFAMNCCLLDGFEEWLCMKINDKREFTWQHLVLFLAFPDNPWAHCRPVTDNRLAIDMMFDLLEEFLTIKNEKNRGARWIYAQYEKWLNNYNALKELEDSDNINE